jgi:hypothetical protein
LGYFYQTCVAIALLQGISLPFVILVFRSLSRRQRQESADLKAELNLVRGVRGRKTKSTDISRLIHDDVPKLQPLNCEACGAGVLLKETGTLCPNCETKGKLPEDYTAAVSLRREVKKLLKSALRHWRVANILTLPLATSGFIALGVIEPLLALLLTAIIQTRGNTVADRLMASLGTPLDALVYLFLISGIVIWSLMLLCLAVTGFELRKKLPVVPVFEEKLRSRETAACCSCGGAIEYDGDDFACICSYCNVENFRVLFTRRKRAEGEQQKTETNFALFGARRIIENYVTLVYVSALIFFGFPLVLVILGIMIYAATTQAFVLAISALVVLAVLFAFARFVFLEERIPN